MARLANKTQRTRTWILQGINGQAVRMFGPVKTADESTLRRRWVWLRQLETSLLANERPSWV